MLTRLVQLNPERPQTSALVDLKDPIQVHLLAETALSDSKQWEILSQEEVDDLKKQCQSLTQRIEQARANLAIQSKYRDAAISMSKLYATGSTRGSSDQSTALEAEAELEAEREACRRLCEELAAELFSLEKRVMEPQRRLLQHTAAILQLTHRASKRAAAPAAAADGTPANGIPGSPESLYTFSNSRSSRDPGAEEPYFDDRSLYISLDRIDQGSARPRKNTLEIPMRSPIREQTNQLREESERLREENGRLQSQLTAQLQVISDAETKLSLFGARLQEIIIQSDEERNAGYPAPPTEQGGDMDLVADQLEYLGDGLIFLRQEQAENMVDPRAAASLAQAEERVATLNRRVHDLLRDVNSDEAGTPAPSGPGLEGQLDWLHGMLRTVESELVRATDMYSGGSGGGKQVAPEEMEAVLVGLWDMIQSGFADMQKRKEERRKTRVQMGLPPDDDDASGDETADVNEPYSLPAFAGTIRGLYRQATNLKEQKSVLKRQIKQQRELNSKSDLEKGEELRQKGAELDSARELLHRTEKEALEAQEKLALALLDLESLRATSAQGDSAAVQAAQEQLQERNAAIAELELGSEELQARIAEVEAELAGVSARLAEAAGARQAVEANAERLQNEVRARDEELEQMSLMVVELKTEVTIARAELDGAYGSRSERAAEAAKLSSRSENDELRAQVDKLRAELAATLNEFEGLTKDTLGAEKEKLELEGRLDDALAARTSLEAEIRVLGEKTEAEVTRLKEQLDGERLRAGGAVRCVRRQDGRVHAQRAVPHDDEGGAQEVPGGAEGMSPPPPSPPTTLHSWVRRDRLLTKVNRRSR